MFDFKILREFFLRTIIGSKHPCQRVKFLSRRPQRCFYVVLTDRKPSFLSNSELGHSLVTSALTPANRLRLEYFDFLKQLVNLPISILEIVKFVYFWEPFRYIEIKFISICSLHLGSVARGLVERRTQRMSSSYQCRLGLVLPKPWWWRTVPNIILNFHLLTPCIALLHPNKRVVYCIIIWVYIILLLCCIDEVKMGHAFLLIIIIWQHITKRIIIQFFLSLHFHL